MKMLRFTTERSYVGGAYDAAYLSHGDDADIHESFIQAAMQSISTELNITVSGVTMFLAAWEDPDHWSSDWAEKLGIDLDDVPDAVAELLAQAIEEDG